MCCKLLHVIELEKPANKWCEHCRPGCGGCTIYETRPQICRSYACGWLMLSNVSDEWYPMLLHMILSLGVINGIQTVTVTVHPKHPQMWKEQPYYSQLKQMSRRGLNVDDPKDILLLHVRVNNRVWMMTPDDDVEITRGSYIVKMRSLGHWEIEQFHSSRQAEERVAELT